MSYNLNLQSKNIKIQNLIDKANTLPDKTGGVELPTLINPAETSEVFLNKEIINQNGEISVGTFTLDNELNAQDNLILQIQTALEGKAAGGAEPILQSKTVSPNTSSQVIKPDSGYDGLEQVTVNAIPSEFIIPSGTLTIATNGTHDVKNYTFAEVNVAGSGSSEDAEKLNDFVDGTMTSYSNDTLTKVRVGLFMKFSSLSQISLPECTRVYASGFRECYKLEELSFPKCTQVDTDGFYQCSSVTTISFPQCKTILDGAFARCVKLSTVFMPNCTSVSMSGFASCSKLTSIDFPVCTLLNNYAFNTCSLLTDVSMPALQTLNNSAFSNCYALSTISLPAATTISAGVFMKCYNLKSLYLMGSTVCALKNSNAFTSTPIGGYSASAKAYGTIYVPASMLATYQAATNWTYFSSRMVGI